MLFKFDSLMVIFNKKTQLTISRKILLNLTKLLKKTLKSINRSHLKKL